MPIDFQLPVNLKWPMSLRSTAIAGLGLASSVWILDGVTEALGDWMPALVIGSGLTWGFLKIQGARSGNLDILPKSLTVDTVKTAVAEAEGIVNQLAQEVEDFAQDENPATGQQLAKLRLQIHELLTGLDRREIHFAIMGGQSVGKTSLKGLLDCDWLGGLAHPEQSHQIQVEDTPALFSAALDGMAAEQQAWQLAKTADVVMFVTDGDLTETQMQVLQRLRSAHRRTVVVFNKQDQYLPKEQLMILAKIRERVAGVIQPEDVIAIATQPRPIKVRQLQEDGSVNEWLEEPETQIKTLIDRLNNILLQEGQKLIWASSLGNAEALKSEAQVKLNSLRRERALPFIDRAQWLVAGAAFANPFPALDLLATAAINAQLVMELSKLYQRELTIEQAKFIATTLAGLMLKMGVVEVSTQAVSGVLKTNAVTYAAGGLVQGVSAAYLTRVAGITLAEYFEAESNLQRLKKDKLQQILASVFERNQRTAFLQMFVKQMLDRLLAEIPSLKSTVTTAVELEPAVVNLPSSQADPWHLSADLQAIRLEVEQEAEELISR
jgi:uncharacterized protein